MAKKDITDTAQLSSTEKLAVAALPGGVIAQEARGQRQLVESTQLPTEGLLGRDRPRWEALGVKILDKEEELADPLFCRVEMPAGWRKVPTDHPLWTDLVDEGGQVIASICYKAAFYDRHAHITLNLLAPDCVCADCGHEQLTMYPCERCNSARVVTFSVARELFGDNWRDAFAPEKSES